jgi:GNAT superfamily N-acetyltransferase
MDAKNRIILNSLLGQLTKWTDSLNKEGTYFGQRTWLKTKGAQVYVRSMARGQLNNAPVICLATIDIDEDHQNKGILKALIKHIIDHIHYFSEIEIENISSKRLLDYCLESGFTLRSSSGISEMYCHTVTKQIKRSQ